jgi:hypothetical protein
LLVNPNQLDESPSFDNFGSNLRSSVVPALHVRADGYLNACTVGRVPAHLRQTTAVGRMSQDRSGFGGLDTDAFVAARVGVDSKAAEDFVCLLVFFEQCLGAAEAIDERGQAAFAVCVGEEVECLETLW